jgi:hypothetical protein
MTSTGSHDDDPIIVAGMKVMFHHGGSWFVGDILHFDEERQRYLIQRQANRSQVWISEGLVRPLANGSPKSVVAP